MLIVDLLLLSLAVALEPIPLTLLILVLSSERGTLRGLWFLAGWVGCLVAVLAIALLISGGHPVSAHHPSAIVNVLKLLAGVALLWVALYEHRRRHAPPKESTWMARIDHLNAVAVAGVAAFMVPQAVVFAAGTVVLGAHVAALGEYLVLVGFVLLGSAPYVGLVIYTAFWPQTSRQHMDRLRLWLLAHRTQVIVLVSLVVGLWLVGRTLYQVVMA